MQALSALSLSRAVAQARAAGAEWCSDVQHHKQHLPPRSAATPLRPLRPHLCMIFIACSWRRMVSSGMATSTATFFSFMAFLSLSSFSSRSPPAQRPEMKGGSWGGGLRRRQRQQEKREGHWLHAQLRTPANWESRPVIHKAPRLSTHSPPQNSMMT